MSLNTLQFLQAATITFSNRGDEERVYTFYQAAQALGLASVPHWNTVQGKPVTFTPSYDGLLALLVAYPEIFLAAIGAAASGHSHALLDGATDTGTPLTLVRRNAAGGASFANAVSATTFSGGTILATNATFTNATIGNLNVGTAITLAGTGLNNVILSSDNDGSYEASPTVLMPLRSGRLALQDEVGGGVGGASTMAFGTITVNGVNVIAVTAPDSVEFIAGTDVTLTGNNSLKTVSFAVSSAVGDLSFTGLANKIVKRDASGLIYIGGVAAGDGTDTSAMGPASIGFAKNSGAYAGAQGYIFPPTWTAAINNFIWSLPAKSGTFAFTNDLHSAVTVSGTGLNLVGQVLSLVFGTSAGQVAEGNHSHAQLHDRSHAITSVNDHTAGNWKVFYSNGSGQLVELTLGANGTYLKSNGASAAPTFDTPAGGSATNAFGTIAVSGQSNVVADAAPDTLTFVAGQGLTITTNAGTNTITFAVDSSRVTPVFQKTQRADWSDASITITTALEHYDIGAWPDITASATERNGEDGNGRPMWAGSDSGVTWNVTYDGGRYILTISDGVNTSIYENSTTGENPAGTYVATGADEGEFVFGVHLYIEHPKATQSQVWGGADMYLAMKPSQVMGMVNNQIDAALTPAAIQDLLDDDQAGARAAMKVPASDPTGITGASAISNNVFISESNYDAIGSPDTSTLFFIP